MTYTFDAADQLATVTDWDLNTTSYSYDNAGRMIGVELPNGVESSYGYDDADRLFGIDHVLDPTTLAFVDYTLDNVGNRTQRVDDSEAYLPRRGSITTAELNERRSVDPQREALVYSTRPPPEEA